MKMNEIVDEVNFLLGFPSNENTEGINIERAVLIAFRELKRYMRLTTDKTVPYQPRIDLKQAGIETKKILDVKPSRPRLGLSMSTLDSGNVFQLAAAKNIGTAIGNTTTINIDPVMTELSMAQLRNTLTTDLQWRYDKFNDVIYITHRDPLPGMVTIKYVPELKDVSEIVDDAWIDYLIRMSTANAKLALGRIRSKYTIEGSNVSLDGDVLLNEANDELAKIREELDSKKKALVIVN